MLREKVKGQLNTSFGCSEGQNFIIYEADEVRSSPQSQKGIKFAPSKLRYLKWVNVSTPDSLLSIQEFKLSPRYVLYSLIPTIIQAVPKIQSASFPTYPRKARWLVVFQGNVLVCHLKEDCKKRDCRYISVLPQLRKQSSGQGGIEYGFV